jgi:hypothetical protein
MTKNQMEGSWQWPNGNRPDDIDRWTSTPNPYYHPEHCGLKKIAEIEDTEAYYSYSTIVFWQDLVTGMLYAAHDEGCSCPTPFEQYRSLTDLVLIDSTENARDFIQALINEHQYTEDRWPLRERIAALAAVEAAINANKTSR